MFSFDFMITSTENWGISSIFVAFLENMNFKYPASFHAKSFWK